MADFSQEKKYRYNWESSKFKDVLFEGNKISSLVNDAGYITSAGSILSASFASTASYINTLHQDVRITGSLNVTGSTIQVGNNTLLGNTILSGSIIISGSTTTPSTPTIKIYGDMETNGVIKFDPVVKSIDTSISASYIYVSGSTNDLYFSQNGGGYNNVTRLRWLEGNLYTGLLHGGLITTQSSTVYQIASGSGVIVNLNASIGNDPFPTIQLLQWPNLSASIAPLSASYDQSFIAITSSGGTAIITEKGTPYEDGEYNTKIPIGIVIHQNHSTINAIQTFPSVGYGWKQRSYDFIKAFGPLKIAGYNLTPSGSSTGSLVLSGGTSWVDGRNYTIDPTNPSYIVEANGITTSKIYRYYQSGSDWVYNTNGGAGYPTIDPTNYAFSGSLTPVPVNDWTIQRVFYFPNSTTKAFYIYYGNDHYATKADAIAGLLTEPFTEAPNTAANAIFVGNMILRYNANFTTAASYEFRPAGLFRQSGGGGAFGGGGGTTSAGGSTTQIQYNNSGLFGGVPNLTWDGTTLRATGSFTGSFIGSLLGTSSYATQALTSSYINLAQTASYVLNAVSSSFSSTSSYVNTLNQNVIITGSLAIGTGSIGNGENNLLLGPAPAGGTGEGGQIALLAVGGTYTSSSFIDNYQNQIRILSGPGATSNVGVMAIDLGTRNATFQGAVTASGFNGLPNDYLYVNRNIDQTIVSGNWANRDVIFNNSVVSKGISYNTGTGLASLTGGKVYRITARLAWGAAATYLFQFSCYNSSNTIIGPTVEMVQSTNGTNNISDGTLDFIYAPGSNVDIKIRTTGNTTALSGEYIRGDLNTQLIIQQIA